MKSWKRKAIFLTAFASIAVCVAVPVGIIFSNQEPERVTPTKEVIIEKPNKFISLENELDPTKFYELKDNFGSSKEVQVDGKWGLENDFAIFNFEDELFAQNFLGSHEKAKEFVKKAFQVSIITTRSLSLNSKVKINVKRFVAGQKEQGLHHIEYTPEIQGVIDLFWISSDLIPNTDLIWASELSVFSHEWGHFETLFALGFDDEPVLTAYKKTNSDFNISDSDYPAPWYNDYQGLAFDFRRLRPNINRENMKQIYKWHPDVVVVDKVREFINSVQYTTWKSYSDCIIVPELITRMQLLYTTNFTNSFSSILPFEFGLANIADFVSITHYDFFNGDDGLQSYNWMKSVMTNLYEFDSTLHFDYHGVKHGEDIWMNGSGDPKFKDLAKGQIEWKDGSKDDLTFEHKQIPIGFYKNPFNDSFDYTYVVDSIYMKQTNVKNNFGDDVKDIKFFDANDQEVQNIKYSFESFLNFNNLKPAK